MCSSDLLEKVPITSLSISFVESRYPAKLLKHLKNLRGYSVEETASGIYTVFGDILPIQMIDSRRLSADENLWLKGLSNRLDPFEVIKISDVAVKKDKTAWLQAYMNAIAKANFQAIEEAMNMSNAAVSLDEVLERTGAYARAEERNTLAIAQKMVNLGYPPEAIVSVTGLDSEKVKELFQNKESQQD